MRDLRPDDVVPARRRDDVAGHFVADAGRARARAGRRGRRRLAGELPALRDRLRRRHRPEPARRAVARLARAVFLAAFARAARRAARDADLVHAHWIPSALAALATGKPFVLQVWGTDVELARRAPALVRPLAAAGAARDRRLDVPGRRGASARRERRSRSMPERRRACRSDVGEPAEPPHVLYRRPARARRRESSSSSRRRTGLPRVIVGDGPLRAARAGGGRLRTARRSSARTTSGRPSSACPSRREGYGVVAREAMAYGRPVVATRVGGLGRLVVRVTGLLVRRATRALRDELARVLGDPGLRARLGSGARATPRRSSPGRLGGRAGRRVPARPRLLTSRYSRRRARPEDRLLGLARRARVDARRLPGRSAALARLCAASRPARRDRADGRL